MRRVGFTETCNKAHPRFPNAVRTAHQGWAETFRSPFDSPNSIWTEAESPCKSHSLGGGCTKCTGEISCNQLGKIPPNMGQTVIGADVLYLNGNLRGEVSSRSLNRVAVTRERCLPQTQAQAT